MPAVASPQRVGGPASPAIRAETGRRNAMRTPRALLLIVLAIASLAALLLAPGADQAAAARQGAPPVAPPPVVVPGGPGRFDYMQVDVPMNRLLAAHPEKNCLELLDLATGAFVRHVDTGRCQGVAGDFGGRGGKYFVSVSREQKVV